jgi:hypothetical protein
MRATFRGSVKGLFIVGAATADVVAPGREGVLVVILQSVETLWRRVERSQKTTIDKGESWCRGRGSNPRGPEATGF